MTWFRVGGGSGIPAALKNRMNAVLNKKFGTAVDYPPNGWPDDVNLLGPLPEGTASGSIVTFSDGADDVPLKSCEVALPASLDGYSSVTVHHTDGQTPPVFSEDYTANLGRTIHGGSADIVKGEGTDGYAKDSMTSTYLSGLSSSYIGYEASTNYFGGHPTIWVRNWNYQTAKIRQTGGIGCVCNYFPVSMNNTDIINTQNRIYFDVNGKGISDVAGFIAFVQNLEANNESLDIVYELETKTDFTFDPVEINSRLGDNTMWSDGDMSVTYRRDIDLALQVLLGSRGLMMASPPAIDPANGDQGSEESTENNIETEGEQDAR